MRIAHARKRLLALTGCWLWLGAVGPAPAQTATAAEERAEAQSEDALKMEAKAVWDRWVALTEEHDPEVAELYAEDAVLIRVQRLPDGTQSTSETAASELRPTLTRTLKAARKAGYHATYAEVRLRVEEKGVKIDATRVVAAENQRLPHSWFMVPDQGGSWKIQTEWFSTAHAPGGD